MTFLKGTMNLASMICAEQMHHVRVALECTSFRADPSLRVDADAAPLPIEFCQDDAATYDVLLDPATTIISSAKAHEVTSSDVRPDEKIEADRELVGLPASRLSRLQDFELDGSIDKTVESSCARLPAGEVSTLAEGLKNKGNIVFKLGDTDAAVEIFARVLRCLEPTPGVGEMDEFGGEMDRLAG